MNIFQNAIDSIILGIEDYNKAEPRRLLSATRNLVSGILLLIKYKLSTLSPSATDEVLIKQKIVPRLSDSGELLWQGEGKKTVDVQQMQERCTNLNILVDWNRIKRIVAHRNDIEHYFSSLSHSALRNLIADSFIIIRDFLRTQLQEDPLNCLGEKTWDTLTKVAEVYDKEKSECKNNISLFDWKYANLKRAILEWECTNCGSGLIDITNYGGMKSSACFQCRSCGSEYDFEDAKINAVEDYFSRIDDYSIKDGGEPMAMDCPSCSNHTYDLSENHCLICDESVERECQRCGIDIPAEELDDSGLCSWCNHMMSKDD